MSWAIEDGLPEVVTYVDGGPWKSRKQVYLQVDISKEALRAWENEERPEPEGDGYPPASAFKGTPMYEKALRVEAGEKVDITLDELRLIAELTPKKPEPDLREFAEDGSYISAAQQAVLMRILDESETMHRNILERLREEAPARLHEDLETHFSIRSIKVFETPYRGAEYVVRGPAAWESGDEWHLWMRGVAPCELEPNPDLMV